MVQKRTCDYTGEEIEPGTGIMYVANDGTILHFVDSKAEKNYLLGREARDLEWTEAGRANKGPVVQQVEAEEAEPEPETEEVEDDAETDADAAPDLESVEADAEEVQDEADDEMDEAEAEEAEAETDDEDDEE